MAVYQVTCTTLQLFYFLHLPDFPNRGFAMNVLHFGYVENPYVNFRSYTIWSELQCNCIIIYSLNKYY